MSKATSIALVASALFLLPCASDDGVVRRYVMTVDGRDVRVVEGEDAVIPCTHAEGKQHTIRVIQAPTFLYRSQSFTFEFDAAMQLIVDRDDDAKKTQVTCSHPDGIHFVVTRWDRPVRAADVNDLADEIAAEMENDDTEVSRKVADPRPIGADAVPGIVLHAEADGISDDHWIGWVNQGGRGYVFEMLSSSDHGMLSGRVFGLIQRSFRWVESAASKPAQAAESAPESRPAETDHR